MKLTHPVFLLGVIGKALQEVLTEKIQTLNNGLSLLFVCG